MSRWTKLFTLLVFALPLAGCLSLSVGTEKKPSRLQIDGLATGFAAVDSIRPFNGTILNAGILEKASKQGDWASLELWPLFDVGVGLVGARVKILFFEMGVGVLAYSPKPSNDRCKEDEEKNCSEKDDKEQKSE